jgi:microsomal dipeptidase-like Zn-dependent dipeptidase
MFSRAVDRALHTTALRPPYVVRPDVAAFHRSIPVVDLLVGTVLFRRGFLTRSSHGHVDLPRLRDGGVNLVAMSVATRFPDLLGTLSAPHFASLGIPSHALHRGMATASALLERVAAWERRAGGGVRIVRSASDLEAVLGPGGPVGLLVALQGAHALDGNLENLAPLHALGVRMLAPAHVMDNAYTGSGTGRLAGGLTPAGRALLPALERGGIVVDLAHMSSPAIRDAVPLLRRPFVLSHTGFVDRAGRRSRWRRYSAATRNVATDDARIVAAAGGVIGVTYATQLLGGDTVGELVDTIRWAVDVVGPAHVALGSDLDGGLRAVIDVAGTPLITQGLLDAGVPRDQVAAVMGGNAVGILRAVLAGA